MSTTPHIDELIEHYFDEVADRSELETLQHVLTVSPEAADAFADIARFESLLHVHLGSDGNESRVPHDRRGLGAAVPGSVAAASSISDFSVPHSSFFIQQFASPASFVGSVLFSYVIATLILSTALAVAWAWKLPDHSQLALQPAPNASPLGSVRMQLVGQVTGMVDCEWSDASTATIDRAYVPLGRKYALSAGLMEITYDTGAKVILQGPVTYEVESASGGYLAVGKLTARLEKRGERRGERGEDAVRSTEYEVRSTEESGAIAKQQSKIRNPKSEISRLSTLDSPLFTIKTPTATVTDLGTEFGVEVDREGLTTSHVFRGTVRFQLSTADADKESDAIVLHENESVRTQRNQATEPSVALQRVSANPQAFVRRLPGPLVIRDGFDGVRNYLTEGTAGSAWSGILNAENATRLDTSPNDADGIHSEGQLVMAVPEGVYAGWAEPHRDRTFKNAPYLYVNVPQGDFDVRVQVKSMSEGEYSAAGLMARLDDDNFISVNRNQFPDYHRFHTRSEEAGVDSDASDKQATEGQCALRLVRMGDTFLASSSLDGGQTWTPMTWANGSTLLRRPDMNGAIQVGLWSGTFTSIAATATFEDFTIHVTGGKPVRVER